MELSRGKVDVAKRVVDAYNRRDLDALFAELATPDLEGYPAIVRGDASGSVRDRGGIVGVADQLSEELGGLRWHIRT